MKGDVHMSEVLAIIPARSGSKSVPNKNIRMLLGKPMIAYSIEHALKCPQINRVIVSTDSEEYAMIAQNYGAEVPFIRPKELAQDESLDIDVFEHAINYLKEKENYFPDIVVQLRPTYPVRNVDDITNMIDMLEKDDEADSVRCIVQAKEIAYKMWQMDEKNNITPILNNIREAYNMPRQLLPTIYYQNACIDVVRTRVILEQHSMSGKKILGYVMEHNYDIDNESEFRNTNIAMLLMAQKQKFVFDIDGVIAKFDEKLKYADAKPDYEIIKMVNTLYEQGNYIVLFTARGYKTGIDWKEVTENQLKDWGVKYHELKFGKPDADLYIDDKGISIWRFKELFERIGVNDEE